MKARESMLMLYLAGVFQSFADLVEDVSPGVIGLFGFMLGARAMKDHPIESAEILALVESAGGSARVGLAEEVEVGAREMSEKLVTFYGALFRGRAPGADPDGSPDGPAAGQDGPPAPADEPGAGGP